ncbi:MAG: hypothetical protein ABL911_00955 [Gallionella sp.]
MTPHTLLKRSTKLGLLLMMGVSWGSAFNNAANDAVFEMCEIAA